MDGVIAVVASLSWLGLAAMVLLAVVLFVRFTYLLARDNARVEAEFADTLTWVRAWIEVWERCRQPARHRARRELPGWIRELLAWVGRRGKPAAPVSPPHVAPDAHRPWTERDTNKPEWVSQPSVRAAAPVTRSPWEEIDVTGAVLSGKARLAAEEVPTAVIPAVRDEVAR